MSEDSRREFIRTATCAFAGATMPLPPRASARGRRARLHALVPAEEAWRRFTDALTDALAALEEDQFLIVQKKRTNLYTQFFCEGRYGLRAEAVSDHYLDAGQQHADDVVRQLVALGWEAPTLTPAEDAHGAIDGSPNYFLDVPWPVACDEVAALAARTLREAFRTAHPGGLEYTAQNILGIPVLFPALHLRRASTL